MTRTFIEVPLFTKRWKEIGLGEEECPQKTREIIERRSCKESRLMNMSSLFDDILEGLQQAIDYERGEGDAKRTTYVIDPVKKYNRDEIKQVRVNAGMTQTVFANYLGVSVKTVEAWERGRTHPTGPAYRLMSILSDADTSNPSFIKVVDV